MQKLTEVLAPRTIDVDYSAYVYASYVVVAMVLIMMVAFSVHQFRCAKRQLSKMPDLHEA